MTTTRTRQPLLDVSDLCAGYAGRAALSNVTLSVSSGETVALVGQNGSGKSTLLRSIAGVLDLYAGHIRLCGRNLNAQSVDSRVRSGIGYLRQTRNIFLGLTVAENLALAAESVRRIGDSGQRPAIQDAFPELATLWETRAGLLSGGLRQSLACAMLLMRKPKLLLLDEPIAGLSETALTSLFATLKRYQELDGFAMVIVEHRLIETQPHVGRVVAVRSGRILEDSSDTRLMLDAHWVARIYSEQPLH